MKPAEAIAEFDDFSRQVRAFEKIHAGQASEIFSVNLHTRVEVLQVDDFALPVSINDGEPGNAWVCSPRTTYADYAAEEATRYFASWLSFPIRIVFVVLGFVMAFFRIDKVVAINNWLLSTNIYPALVDVPVHALVESAVKRWPDHALCFRSLNKLDNSDWLEELVSQGCLLVASRQVYLYQEIETLATKHVNLKRDLDLLHKTTYSRIGNEEISERHYERIARLYELLYIDKYSRFNPRYTAEFMRSWHKAGLLEFEGLQDGSGELQAVIGTFQQGTTITAPIVGYNTAAPKKDGLYRLLTACVYEKTMRRNLRLNFSAGAAEFKRLRGGTPAIEYSAFYVRHLSLHRRLFIRFLSFLTCRIGMPLMVRYRL